MMYEERKTRAELGLGADAAQVSKVEGRGAWLLFPGCSFSRQTDGVPSSLSLL
jgi:hypothetical protein